jgi:carboxymethylenebutenolidase
MNSTDNPDMTTDEVEYGSDNVIGNESDPKDLNATVAVGGNSNSDLFATENPALTQGQDVEYMSGVTGYLAMPEGDGTYPGIILVHEWWGLNDNIRTMANLLAQEGYVVLAVDMYEGEYTINPTRAGQLASSVRQNPAKANANMQAAASYLRNLDNVDDDKVASMGWCFGGGQALGLALSGESLAATVIYYGTPLVNDTDQLSKIDWPVLGIFGANDTAIPVSSVRDFEYNLNQLGIENEVYIYPGVGHAFANPSGQSYAPRETVDAWNKTLAFLERNLK